MHKDLVKYKKLFREELFDYVVPFWTKFGQDPVYGGMYTCLDRKGVLYSSDKSVWMQGRAAYMFSYLSNVYADRAERTEWLSIAKSCLDFIAAHCIDPVDGRMYFTVTKEGFPLRKRRYWFSETFYIVAAAEYYKATHDEQYADVARQYYDFVLNMYENPKSDPYKITEKTVASTRRSKALANPMILLNVTAVMLRCDKQNADRYNSVADKLVKDLFSFEVDGQGTLLENVGKNGEYVKDVSAMRVVNPGHSIEASWFLVDRALATHDEGLLKKAAAVFDSAIERGWDKQYGGILYFVDLEGLPVEAYEHDMKLWWPHNEAIIASIKLYNATGDKKYKDWFEKVTKYAFEHFSDREYGEWYGYLRRDGKPTEPPCKGHTYKGPFHVLRMLAVAEQEIKEN